MKQTKLRFISEDEYLAQEKSASIKHEYVDGQIYAMAGASVTHNRIAGNLYTRLRTLAIHGPCEAFISDVKLKIASSSTSSYYYPDVMAVCDPSDDDQFIKTRPCLIAEVLSPTTEAIDRREKLSAYQSISSLREYLLLAQDKMELTLFQRHSLREWTVATLERSDNWYSLCFKTEIPLLALYENTDL